LAFCSVHRAVRARDVFAKETPNARIVVKKKHFAIFMRPFPPFIF